MFTKVKGEVVRVFILTIMLFFCGSWSKEKKIGVDIGFVDGMKPNPEFDIQRMLHDNKWKTVQALYTKNVLKNGHDSIEPRIPLIVHHIWIGSTLPQYAAEFRKSWIKHNPDWTFVLWTDHPSKRDGEIILHSFGQLIDYLKMPKKEQFIVMDMRKVRLRNRYAYEKKAKNYGEKSDIARYEILYNIGGLYVDTDFECLKSFDDLHYCLDFYTGVAHAPYFTLYNGLIASVPRCLILEEAIKGLKKRPRYADSLQYSGPDYFGDCFIRRAKESAGIVVAFPVVFFYPWPHQFRYQAHNPKERWSKRQSYAIHHWKVSWLNP